MLRKSCALLGILLLLVLLPLLFLRHPEKYFSAKDKEVKSLFLSVGKVYTVKKAKRFSRPGIIKLFPSKESLVSNIPAGTEKSLTFFYSAAVQMLN
jgi:hypothetical protein